MAYSQPDASADQIRGAWMTYARHLPECAVRRKKQGVECDCEIGKAQLALEESLKKLVEWKTAIIDAAVVDWVYVAEHEENPRKAINDLLCQVQKIALDPAVSKEAADLYAKIKLLEDTLDRVDAHLKAAISSGRT